MIKNYFKVALRTIQKNPGYAAVNIFGLTLGISSFLLIFLVVQYEFSFDKQHADWQNIYRINNELQLSSGNYKYPTCTSALAPGLQQAMPEVYDYTRLSGGGQQVVIEIDAEFFKEDELFFADKNFLQFFDFELLSGNPAEALNAPNSAVLTERAAIKYFGTTNAVGKTFKANANQVTQYNVTAVLKDLPESSHIQFELLFSNETLRVNNDNNVLFNWSGDGYYSYFKLKEGTSEVRVLSTMAELKAQNIPEDRQNMFNPEIIPLADIHLHSNLRNEIVPNGNIDFVYIFSAVAIFILVIAGINYMNLATARSAKRAQEVGIRKVLGAVKNQLMTQFLSESIILTGLSAVLSLVIISTLIGPFSGFIDRSIGWSAVLQAPVLLVTLLIVLIIGFGSGIYPAIFLSSFRPVVVLKSKLVPGMGSSGIFRKALVVFQFAISIVMIIGTAVVYDQLTYMKNKPLGYEKENIMLVSNTNQAVTPQIKTFKTELMKFAGIESVSASLSKPGGLRPIIFIRSETVVDDEGLNLAGINIDLDYFNTMNIEVVEGRNFDPNIPTDSTQAIIVNKKAVQELNMQDGAVGKYIDVQSFQGNWDRKQIIGVIDNINFEPLQRGTESCFYANFFPVYQHFYIKLNPGMVNASIQEVERVWQEFAPDQPFEYSFLEDDLNSLYQSEEQLSQVVIYFAFLAVLIASLGLFGLASFSTEQRIKEIGVRKVLGASVSEILFILSKDFALLVVLAFVVAAPLAYYLADWWLQNFAFSVNVSVLTFVLSGLGALLIALLTVSYKTLAAARSNPVKALRSE